MAQQLVSPPKSASLPRGGRAAHVWACSTGDARREREQQRLRGGAGRRRARRGMFGAVPCRVDLRSRSASLDAAQEAVTAGAAHRHRSVLKRRSCRHRGGDRARRAHDKTCVRDGGELGRGWWAENASRYGRAGPRRAPRRNRALRTNRRNRRTDKTAQVPTPPGDHHHPCPKVRIPIVSYSTSLAVLL